MPRQHLHEALSKHALTHANHINHQPLIATFNAEGSAHGIRHTALSSRGTSRPQGARRRAILAQSLRTPNCSRGASLLRIPPKVQRRLCKAPSQAMRTAAAPTAKTLQALALTAAAAAAAAAEDRRRKTAMTSSKRYQRLREIRRPMTGVRVLWTQRSHCQCAGPSPLADNRSRAQKAKNATGPANSSGKQVAGGAFPASSEK